MKTYLILVILDENQELMKKKNKIDVGIFKTETPENNLRDEFIALRSKIFSFKCDDKNTNKLREISKSYSKHKKHE